jgi:flavin reductase (DIM6/NTAB) family NADH-FMN oxidoreductase RutF
MATLNEDGTTNFNILTYATPVSIRPARLYSLGLYKETLSYKNFCRDRKCVLQLLTADHIPLVRLLGGKSGRDVDKEKECATMSDDPAFGLQELGSDLPKVLPGCAHLLRLSASGDIVNGGSHDIAICKVDEMLLPSEDYVANSVDYLSTGRLRELGIITEQGRIAD